MFDFARRRAQIFKTVQEMGGDAILVTNEINVRYLSGFTGDSSYLLLTADKQMILSDSRYDTQIRDECSDLELVTRTAKIEMRQSIAQTVAGVGAQRIVIETDAMTKAVFDGLCQELPSVSWKDSSLLIQNQRAVKDAQEVELICKSVDLAQQAFVRMRSTLSGEMTERQVAHQMENTIRELGGEGRAFDMIVGVGPRAALPHAGISTVKIKEAASVLIDWGANYQGYASDLTRVLITGEPSTQLIEIYNVVLQAQQIAIQLIQPGADLRSIDQAARQHIQDSGYGDFFGHGLGHGFGLQIHEQPRFSPTAQGVLSPGMVVTVEPGIYIPDECGVRIEDDVLVTHNGHEVLSDLPKSLEDNFVSLL